MVNPDINNGAIIDQGFYHGGVERGWNLHRGRDWWAGGSVAENSVVWNSHHTNTGYNANHNMYAKSNDGQTPNNQTQIIIYETTPFLYSPRSKSCQKCCN